MYDITPILQAFVSLLAAFVAVFFIPWIRSKTTAEQRKEIADWVKIAVAAAEQLYQGSGRGEEKKQYVLEWLYGNGLAVDESQLDAMIEAAVYELSKAVE